VKPHTKIGFAGMPSTHGRKTLRNEQLSLILIVQADAQDLIVALDPLCRAILVLKVAIRSSIQDCVFRLNVSPAAVLAANCHAMTWLDHCRVKLLDEHKVSHAL
jgi:hypothetical protein